MSFFIHILNVELADADGGGGVTDCPRQAPPMGPRRADRVRYLNGQITQQVDHLPKGEARYAVITNHKGKLEADLHFAHHPEKDGILIDAHIDLRESLFTRLDRYIIADDAMLAVVPGADDDTTTDDDKEGRHTHHHHNQWGNQDDGARRGRVSSRRGFRESGGERQSSDQRRRRSSKKSKEEGEAVLEARTTGMLGSRQPMGQFPACPVP